MWQRSATRSLNLRRAWQPASCDQRARGRTQDRLCAVRGTGRRCVGVRLREIDRSIACRRRGGSCMFPLKSPFHRETLQIAQPCTYPRRPRRALWQSQRHAQPHGSGRGWLSVRGAGGHRRARLRRLAAIAAAPLRREGGRRQALGGAHALVDDGAHVEVHGARSLAPPSRRARMSRRGLHGTTAPATAARAAARAAPAVGRARGWAAAPASAVARATRRARRGWSSRRR